MLMGLLRKSLIVVLWHAVTHGWLFFLFHSNPDHYSTSSKFSGVDVNLARLLFHRVVQHNHPEITQLVSAHSIYLTHYCLIQWGK